MSEQEKKEVWEYIIELSLKCAADKSEGIFEIVENAKKGLNTPKILK